MDNPIQPLFRPKINSLELLSSGKVREIYAVDDRHILIVVSDRLSAFDVILPDPIPGKGHILTEVSDFWFERTHRLVKNHSCSLALQDIINDKDELRILEGRSTVVSKLTPLPVEAVVRGYITGSGWKEYQQTGAICGIKLPPGLQQAQGLPEAIFTPSTKAATGAHDENISFGEMTDLIGEKMAGSVRELSLKLYAEAAEYALRRGIIIADTKFEFGLNEKGELILMDEVLTPDSSRFWPADSYRVGISPPSFDKQYIRDYLEKLDWDKTAPGPSLPQEVIDQTAVKYHEAQQRLRA